MKTTSNSYNLDKNNWPDQWRRECPFHLTGNPSMKCPWDRMLDALEQKDWPAVQQMLQNESFRCPPHPVKSEINACDELRAEMLVAVKERIGESDA